MKSLLTTRLQNAEHLAFMNDLLLLLNETKFPELNELTIKLAEGVKDEKLSQKEIKKSEYTEQLIKLDELRDTIYQGLVFRLKSELCSLNENVKTAAQKIKLVTDTYGNFVNYNYQKETAEIQNFIEELQLAQYSDAITLTGLSEWVGWLDNINKEFLEAYTARRDEYASRLKLNTRDIRISNDLIFKEMKKIISAMEILQPSDELTLFISKIDTSIDKWNNILNQRHAKSTNEDEQPIDKEEDEEQLESINEK